LVVIRAGVRLVKENIVTGNWRLLKVIFGQVDPADRMGRRSSRVWLAGKILLAGPGKIVLNVYGRLRTSVDNNSQLQPTRTDWMDGIPGF
jgi:hypothetical protein